MSLGAVYLGTFLYPFVSNEVLVCLHFKGCVALSLRSTENWEIPFTHRELAKEVELGLT